MNRHTNEAAAKKGPDSGQRGADLSTFLFIHECFFSSTAHSRQKEVLYNIVVLPKSGVFALNLAAVRDFLENGCGASFLYLTW